MLCVSQVQSKTPTFRLFRDLIAEGYDKGESELGAWIKTNAPTSVMVSCDHKVPKMAKQLKIASLDLGQLVVVLVKDGLISEATARERLKPWENPHTGIGRPAGWTSLTAALAGPRPLS